MYILTVLIGAVAAGLLAILILLALFWSWRETLRDPNDIASWIASIGVSLVVCLVALFVLSTMR
jgi:hypothetical protein